MREPINEFVRIVAETMPIAEPIYEFGALQVPGQERFADLRPIFPGKQFVGTDMQEGPGVDKVLDLHSIDLPDDSVGAVLCLETVEHVEYPHKALQEIHRVLRPGGIAAISSSMWAPIHNHPSDYWRFTPMAFEVLLRPFSSCYVSCLGEEAFPHAVFGIGFKDVSVPLETLQERMEYLSRRWHEPDAEPWTYHRPLVSALKLFVPPVFVTIARRALWRLGRHR